MKKYYYTIIAILFVSVFTVNAQVPDGYYDAAEGKTGDELKGALNEIIKGHTEKSYGEARYILEECDLAVGSTDSLRTLYTYHKVKAEWDAGSTWNREHVWSKSRGFDVDVSNSHRGIGSDIHNLRACISSVNSAKNNRWFSECDEAYYYGGDFTGSYTNNSGGDENWLWEPRDEDKGDVARIIFYMVTRYEGNDDEVDLEMVDYIPSDKYTTDPIYALFSDLMQWHIADPVDEFEINRNNVIYESQNNRNPFIDRPEFATLVFATAISNVQTLPNTPLADQEVDVSAIISPQIAIESVVLKWGTQEDDLINVIPMSLSDGATYITDNKIPGQSSGSVYFVVEAIDDAGVEYLSDINNYSIPVGVLFSEDFETVIDNEDIVLTGWTNLNEIGDRKWIGKSYNDNKYAQFSSYNSGSSNVGWFIVPTINLDETTGELFSFDVNVGYWKHEALRVLISSDYNGDNVQAATWEDIGAYFSIPQEPGDGYGEFASAGTFDLSEYIGETTIAFKYEGGDPDETTTMQIDNVVVSGEATSIYEKQRFSLNLFPNPTKDELVLGQSFTNVDVKIFNVLGVEVYSENFSGSNLFLNDLANGQYLIQITDANQIYLEQFVILK